MITLFGGRYWDRTSDLFGVNEIGRFIDLLKFAVLPPSRCVNGRGCPRSCFSVVTQFVTHGIAAISAGPTAPSVQEARDLGPAGVARAGAFGEAGLFGLPCGLADVEHRARRSGASRLGSAATDPTSAAFASNTCSSTDECARGDLMRSLWVLGAGTPAKHAGRADSGHAHEAARPRRPWSRSSSGTAPRRWCRRARPAEQRPRGGKPRVLSASRRQIGYT
jgi:hypothetical protein